MDEYRVRVRFGDKLMDLFHIGYLSVDLVQLIAFAERLEERDLPDQDLADLPRFVWRYAVTTEARGRIVSTKVGSLEQVVAVGSFLASVLMPLVQIRVQRQIGNMQFEVEAEDEELSKALRIYAEGGFGKGPDAINNLFAALSQMGYRVHLRGTDAFAIDSMLEVTARRIVRTIQKVQ
jgi:hypothetical protein